MPTPPSTTPRHTPDRIERRWLKTALAGGLGLATMAVSVTGTASATPRQHVGNQPAPHRSVRAFGSGTMGWEHHTQAASQAAAQEVSRAAVSPATAGTPTATLARAKRTLTPSGVLGMDVSRYQGNVNWLSYRLAGKQFAYVKATEGSSYRNPYFGTQYTGAFKAGMFHGAYHFASPSGTSGAVQADYFVAHGGGWSADGRTLPGVLDIEYNPYGATCYGLSKPAMVAWIKSFTKEYKRKTSRDAVIYSTTNWWSQCTGNSAAFSSTNPLWIARYSTSAGTLPHNWKYYTFWQYNGTGLDLDTFNGSNTRLRALALG